METRLVSRRALLTSLIGAGASATTLAQQPDKPVIVNPRKPGYQQPGREVLAGPDIGFRVEGVDRDGTRIGAFVVRVDDKWVNVRSAMGVAR